MDTRIIPEGNLAEKAMPPEAGSEKRVRSAGVLKYAGTAFVAAAIVNILIFLVARAVGLEFQMLRPDTSELQPITAVNVILATALGVAGAAIVFFILARFSKYADVIFQAIAFAFLLLSFTGPLMLLPAADTLQKILLAAMHVVVAVVTVALFLKNFKKI